MAAAPRRYSPPQPSRTSLVWQRHAQQDRSHRRDGRASTGRDEERDEKEERRRGQPQCEQPDRKDERDLANVAFNAHLLK